MEQYQRFIENSYPSVDSISAKGAILSCVVGGKMSEGINFSDGLGRCVIMVGLPYPNPNDAVLAEKVNYINKMNSNNNKSTSGSEYYDNLCMKAVNQSIGIYILVI